MKKFKQAKSIQILLIESRLTRVLMLANKARESPKILARARSIFEMMETAIISHNNFTIINTG